MHNDGEKALGFPFSPLFPISSDFVKGKAATVEPILKGMNFVLSECADLRGTMRTAHSADEAAVSKVGNRAFSWFSP